MPLQPLMAFASGPDRPFDRDALLDGDRRIAVCLKLYRYILFAAVYCCHRADAGGFRGQGSDNADAGKGEPPVEHDEAEDQNERGADLHHLMGELAA